MEVLKTALQLEIDAENHYRNLAAQTEDIGLVNILNRLAEVEQRGRDPRVGGAVEWLHGRLPVSTVTSDPRHRRGR